VANRLLYELAGEDPERRFSPYCWRIRFALQHKGLSFETVPWRFSDRDAIAFSGQAKVPVLVDGEHVVSDSWEIAQYLESTYPDSPSLLGASGALVLFMAAWADTILLPAVSALILADIPSILHERDRDYFRESRETRFGRTLESLCQDRETRVVAFRQSLLPLRRTLARHDFLGGQQPDYADYCVFSVFQWARCSSDFALLEHEDVVTRWGERMLGLYGCMAGAALGRTLAASKLDGTAIRGLFRIGVPGAGAWAVSIRTAGAAGGFDPAYRGCRARAM